MASANLPPEPLKVPAAAAPAPAPAAAAAAAAQQPQALRHRKKPHMLPPLEKRRNSDVPQVDCRAEVGSPTPKWRRPSLEEQLILEEPPKDGRPAIRLTRCPDAKGSPPAPQQASLHVASRYAPLEPIKRRDPKQL